MVFTGLVACLGQAAWLSQRTLCVTVDIVDCPANLKIGDSVAIDGVCLTVCSIERTRRVTVFKFSVHAETLAVTTLSARSNVPWSVNVEWTATQLGGHVVYGHVHGIAQITACTGLDAPGECRVRVAASGASRVRPKGAVALNGVSLTVTDVSPDGAEFGVALIPHTLKSTTFGKLLRSLPCGINIEYDMTQARPTSGDLGGDGVAPDRVTRAMCIALTASYAAAVDSAPEPPVGAALIDLATGEVVATGRTGPGGVPHAEIDLLTQARDRYGERLYKQNSTDTGFLLCSTLEPCHDYHADGPVVPCVDAIVAAPGIRYVVYAATDHDPRESGKGAAALRAKGVLCEQLADCRVRRAVHAFLLAHAPQRTMGVPTLVDGAAAAAAYARGEIVVVADDEDRENECDLVVDARTVTEAQVALLIRSTTGILCAALWPDRARDLQLGYQTSDAERAADPMRTGFTVSVDAADCTTGVSAADRLKTFRALARADAAGLRRGTGHVFPLIARAGGLCERRGHTEAAAALARWAAPVGEPGAAVGILSELRTEDGVGMMRRADAAVFAARHGLCMTTVAALEAWQKAVALPRNAALVPLAECTIDLRLAIGSESRGWRILAYGDEAQPHRALVLGDVRDTDAPVQAAPVLVRVHSDCWWGDALHSLLCDCRAQLDRAKTMIAAAGRGVIIFPAAHEGRGIGLVNKIRAYAARAANPALNTYQANVHIGQPEDARDFSCVVPILESLGVRRVRLLTSNPAKIWALGALCASSEPLITPSTPQNERYLGDKSARHAAAHQ